MRKSLLGLLGLALVGGPVLADPADELIQALSDNPNLFVESVQRHIHAEGYYAGDFNGLLTATTIKAITSFCRDRAIQSSCARGPLSQQGSEAIARSMLSDVQSNNSPIMLRWKSRPRNGLTINLSHESEIGGVKGVVSGVAVEGGWINIDADPPIPASPGDVLSVQFEVGAWQHTDDPLKLRARIAAIGDGGAYLGELIEREPEVRTPGVYDVVGKVPEGAVAVRPYLQFKYSSGTRVNSEFVLLSATASREKALAVNHSR